MEDHVRTDEPLTVEDRMPPVQPQGLADEHEPVTWPNLATEPDILHAAEGDESIVEQVGLFAEEARELRGGLANQDSGH